MSQSASLVWPATMRKMKTMPPMMVECMTARALVKFWAKAWQNQPARRAHQGCNQTANLRPSATGAPFSKEYCAGEFISEHKVLLCPLYRSLWLLVNATDRTKIPYSAIEVLSCVGHVQKRQRDEQCPSSTTKHLLQSFHPLNSCVIKTLSLPDLFRTTCDCGKFIHPGDG